MPYSKIIEKLLLSLSHYEKTPHPECCIVCSSDILSSNEIEFPHAFIVSNAGCQTAVNLGSIYFGVKKYNLPLIAVVESNKTNIKELLNIKFPAADVEFKLLEKTVEENYQIVASLYDDEKLINTAFIELNIDAQIEVIKKVDFDTDVTVCGFVLDELSVYNSTPSLYLTNFCGIKDPEAIRQIDALNNIPQKIKETKIKRLHIQI